MLEILIQTMNNIPSYIKKLIYMREHFLPWTEDLAFLHTGRIVWIISDSFCRTVKHWQENGEFHRFL